MLSQNQIALLINSFSQLTTNTNYVTTIKINASYKTTQSFNYQGNTVKPLIDLYSGNTVVILQDTSTKLFYAIREDFNPVLNERTFTRKYREEEKKLPSREEADVAVLLSCEKDDAYDFWITWLGDRRKNRFAYVGEMPKRLQTEQYWAWESNQGGRFEFNPYTGATGGGISIGTTPNNYDGAIVEAGPSGAFYHSEGWRGGGDGTVEKIENVEDVPGGDLGGVVTPVWSRVLTDYSVTARTYLQTLCLPLGMYTDVSWEWSDGGGGYALRKVPGDGVTTSSSDKTIGTRWEVEWSYDGGGGSVGVSQVNSPRVVKKMSKPGEEVELEEGKTKVWIVEWEEGREVFFTGEDDTLTAEVKEGSILYGFSSAYVDSGTYNEAGPKTYSGSFSLPTPAIPGPDLTFTGEVDDVLDKLLKDLVPPVGGFQIPFLNIGPVEGETPSIPYVFRDVVSWVSPAYLRGTITYPSSAAQQYFIEIKINGIPSFTSDEYGYEPSPTLDSYSIDPEDPEPNPPPGYSYSIQVFDEDDIEVASDSASSPISSTTEKIETKRVGFYIKKDGENINGQFDSSGGLLPPGFQDGEEVPEEYRDFEVRNGENPPSVYGGTTLVIARVDAWVEVAGMKLAAVTLNGKDGQKIIDSPQYEEAIKPYTGPDGRTVYPCFPQKTEDPPEEETASFQADEGFNAYHVTWYNTRKASINGDTTRHEPFDFNNPDLSGPLPSPAINYLTSLVSTDLIIDYVPVGNLSWGKDLPEEGTNLEEEKEDGVDPYGVVYSFVKGFTYALYGPTKTNQSTTSKVIDGAAGETLLGNYDFLLFTFRNRQRKPRLYVLNPDKTNEGRPFEEYDISDLNQRGLHQLPSTMGETFRRELWGYDLSPVANEYEEDWATERVTFAANPSGGDTPFERQYLNDETANSSTVKQRGDKTVDITVKMEDVEALLKATSKARVEFTIHDSQRPSETTIKTFKMNPIQDVFEGYSDVKILAVAGVVY